MPQRTLYQYFHFPAKPPLQGLSFLDLPHFVRHRIYVLAGLVRLCPIDMNQEGQGRLNPRERTENFDGSWGYRSDPSNS